MSCSTDWSLLVQGFMSFTWCEETMKAEHQGRLVSDLLSEFKSKNSGVNPLNVGSMLAAAYICFMYPQQSEFESLDYSSIPTDKFNVTVGKTEGSKYLCRRIRNSLAHARFQVSNGFFRFEDEKPCGGDKFKAEIEVDHFGDFLNVFFHESKNQHFGR